MDIKEKVTRMDSLVTAGSIVEAIKTFFSGNAQTADYGDVNTAGKTQMVEKMEGFTGSIAKVNGIKHHHTIVDGNVSASEFTFDFDMKDGSHINWHEIIRRVWNDEGRVIDEAYFNAQ